MIKPTITIFILLFSFILRAQPADEKLTATIREFHQALIAKNTVSINQQTDKALSYGHSNGWVETKTDLLKNLQSGYMSYQRFMEDSFSIMSNGNMANARFVAEVNATLNGTSSSFKLRVLEVWVKKGNRWLLFARQAVKKQS